MNNLQQYSNAENIFSGARLNNSEYTLSLLKEALRLGYIDEAEEAAVKAKVFDGLAALEREGETSNVGKYVYSSNDEAFDAACTALKEILNHL